MKQLIGIIAVLVIIVGGYFALRGGVPASNDTGTQTPGATVAFACNEGKSITAQFMNGESKPAADPNVPPTPGGSVNLTLSDGRTMSLPQTISADGARYANADEALVFWSKGNGATITEGSQPTYTCIMVPKDPGGLPEAYYGGSQGFAIRLPSGFTTDAAYKYDDLGPGKTIGGVKFTIPASMATGTNLSDDTYISVEEIANASSCSASLFTPSKTPTSTVNDGDTTYSFASTSDAAAGNRYEEYVYAIPGTNPCTAVRYFIHYGAIGNYPEGAVEEFDKQALISKFDSIRRTLTLD